MARKNSLFGARGLLKVEPPADPPQDTGLPVKAEFDGNPSRFRHAMPPSHRRGPCNESRLDEWYTRHKFTRFGERRTETEP